MSRRAFCPLIVDTVLEPDSVDSSPPAHVRRFFEEEMMRAFLAGLAVLATASLAAGQEAGKDAGQEAGQIAKDEQDALLLDTASRLMASQSYAVRAWGAYIAGRHGLEEAVPLLRGLLRPPPEDTAQAAAQEAPKAAAQNAKRDLRYVQYAALDALIRLEADVPPAELLALSGRFKTHALLLMAGDPEENQIALLDLIRSSSTSRACWAAVCNLIVPLKTPGLAAYLLENLDLKVNLAVLDQDGQGGGAGGGMTFGDGWFAVPEGFPPTTLYELQEKWSSGAFLVAPGEHPVFCRRRIVQPGKNAGTGSSGSDRTNNQYRMEFLARLAETKTDDLGFKPSRHESIRWTDADGFTAEVNYIRTKIRKDFESFAGFYQSEGLLAPEEKAGLRPRIEFNVHDLRKDKSAELPPVPSR